MQRFYYPFELTPDMVLDQTRIVHQLTHVLRSKSGETIILFNWDWWENVYEIRSIDKKQIFLHWTRTYRNKTINQHKVHLFQAIPNKYEKIEYIIEKGVEVGITDFTFFHSDFSQKLQITDSKIKRFNTIAREALEQCGGAFPPTIRFIGEIHFSESYSTVPIILHTKSVQKLNYKSTMSPSIIFFVWPEWWWSERELSEMISYGFIFVHFWERVLRTETASSVFAFWYIHTKENLFLV